jgi:ADP-heptose:LPS heptosyltransferase
MAGLFVHQGALGDWVITWPILRALAVECGFVFAVASGEKARLAARFIEGVVPVDIETGWHIMHQCDIPMPPMLAVDYFELSHIVSYVSNGVDPWARNILRFAPQASIAYVHPRPPDNWHEHVLNWQYGQIDHQLPLNLAFDDAPTHRTPEGPVVIHPGSGGANKCWPRDYYEVLITELRDAGHRTQVVLGEVELETWPEHVIDNWQERFDVLMPDTLDALADILLEARLVIANDSGPMHLADQLGKPLLALFGPSNLRHWHPNGELAACKVFLPRDLNGSHHMLGPDRIYPLVERWLEMSNYQ